MGIWSADAVRVGWRAIQWQRWQVHAEEVDRVDAVEPVGVPRRDLGQRRVTVLSTVRSNVGQSRSRPWAR